MYPEVRVQGGGRAVPYMGARLLYGQAAGCCRTEGLQRWEQVGGSVKLPYLHHSLLLTHSRQVPCRAAPCTCRCWAGSGAPWGTTARRVPCSHKYCTRRRRCCLLCCVQVRRRMGNEAAEHLLSHAGHQGIKDLMYEVGTRGRGDRGAMCPMYTYRAATVAATCERRVYLPKISSMFRPDPPGSHGGMRLSLHNGTQHSPLPYKWCGQRKHFLVPTSPVNQATDMLVECRICSCTTRRIASCCHVVNWLPVLCHVPRNPVMHLSPPAPFPPQLDLMTIERHGEGEYTAKLAELMHVSRGQV